MRKQIPTEIYALIHHVELSRSGWRDKAMDVFTTYAVGTNQHGVQTASIPSIITTTLGISQIAPAQIDESLKRLKKNEVVIYPSEDHVKLTEMAYSQISKQFREAVEHETRLEQLFESILHKLDTSYEMDWKDFKNQLLCPMVFEIGARAYEVLSGELNVIDESETLRGYLDSLSGEELKCVTELADRFFDAGNEDVRKYILRTLNASFLVQSTRVNERVIEAVSQIRGKKTRFRVFVDTNFLFSLLGLHENPADDVVKALKGVIEQVNSSLEVKLYMLPITVDEARDTLSGCEQKYSDFRLNRATTDAMARGDFEPSGILLKYIQEILANGKHIPAKDYFGRYNSNFLAIARSKGVEIFNESMEGWSLRQSVIDDITSQLDHETKRYEEHRRKSYRKIEHDIVLWHFAESKRPTRIDTPLEAEYWIATIDFRLLGFDRYKHRGKHHRPPLCIHPTVLLQLLQLWVPRSEELEQAMVNSIHPLIPQDFDPESEAVTVRILSSLSRYEHNDELSHETTTSILFDEALRSRIAGTDDIEEEIELVRSAIIEENRKLDLKAKQLAISNKNLQTEVSKKEEEVAELKANQIQTESDISTLVAELRREREARSELADRVSRRELFRLRRFVIILSALSAVLLGGAVYHGSASVSLKYFEANFALQAFRILIAVGVFCLVSSFVLNLFRNRIVLPVLVKWLWVATCVLWGTIIVGVVLNVFSGLIHMK